MDWSTFDRATNVTTYDVVVDGGTAQRVTAPGPSRAAVNVLRDAPRGMHRVTVTTVSGGHVERVWTLGVWQP
jgi:hypothetical protein